MLLLVVFLILYAVFYQRKISGQREAHQRALLGAAIESQELERERIARDLHDDLQQQFAAVKLAVERVILRLPEGDEGKAILQDAAKMAADSVDATRNIARDLLPPTLSKLGLAEALDELCQRMEGTGMKAGFTLEGEYQRIDKDTELALYRVVQELVANTLKHAEASRLDLSMTCHSNRLSLCVSDNGKGFDMASAKKGLGLRNIESRMGTINGTYHINTSPGKGITVTLSTSI